MSRAGIDPEGGWSSRRVDRAGGPGADARGQGGFTLVEVMIALAILSFALVSMLVFTANNVVQTARAASENVAVDLLRGKMYDLEEELLADGFQELTQEKGPEDFGDEGWPDYAWSATIEKVELPDVNALKAGAVAMAGAEAEAASAAGAAGAAASPGDLAGMLGMGGGTGAADPKAAMGDLLAGANFQLFSDVLEKAIRKIKLTVRWTSGGSPQELVVSYYVTKPSAVSESVLGLMAGAGSGSDSGSGSGSGSGSATRNPFGGGGAKP